MTNHFKKQPTDNGYNPLPTIKGFFCFDCP